MSNFITKFLLNFSIFCSNSAAFPGCYRISSGGGRLTAQESQLFTLVSNPGQLTLTTQQQNLIQSVANEASTLDYKIAVFANPLSFMTQNQITFNVPYFESGTFTAEVETVEIHPDGAYTWIGQIQTLGKGDLMLTVGTGVAPTGFIRFTDRYYSITGLSDTLVLLIEHDLDFYESDNDDVLEDSTNTANTSPPESCDCAVVDILVLETPDARAIINLQSPTYLLAAFATINGALIKSGIPCKRVRFQRHTTTYTPQGGCVGLNIQIHDFKPTNQTLINLRTQYKVDGIIILTTCLDAAGYAVPGVDPNQPYAIVKLDHLFGPRFTLAHEFGHMVSAKHNRISNGGDEPNNSPDFRHGWKFLDSDGYVQRTLLATLSDQNTRLLHYSNPEITYNGAPTGTLTDRNSLGISNGMCMMADNNTSIPPLLTLMLQGNTTLCLTDPEFPHVFNAHINGPVPGPGGGPFSYEWRWSNNMFSPTNLGTLIGGNSPVLTLTTTPTCQSKFFLKVKVTNTLYNIEREAVALVDPSHCTICPDFRSDESVQYHEGNISLSISPNPARNFMELKYRISPAEEAILEIIRIDGQIIQTRNLWAENNGLGEETLNVQGLPSGVYLVRITQSGISTIQKISIIQ